MLSKTSTLLTILIFLYREDLARAPLKMFVTNCFCKVARYGCRTTSLVEALQGAFKRFTEASERSTRYHLVQSFIFYSDNQLNDNVREEGKDVDRHPLIYDKHHNLLRKVVLFISSKALLLVFKDMDNKYSTYPRAVYAGTGVHMIGMPCGICVNKICKKDEPLFLT